ncbi:unnamed protein product [Rotaria sp. Silwood2]|nr:unnamed protein product [Rotaria sp. Silwood2]CAF4626449.1 unnamed protein product [Rotaria sp. Silwood2]
MQWIKREESLYCILNSTLRKEKRDLLKLWFLHLKLILKSLAKLPSIEGRTFYRGDKFNLSDIYRPGKIIVWWDFSSCTSTINVLGEEKILDKTDMPTLFAIECKSAKDIRLRSMYFDENEILSLPAAQFKVVGQYQPSEHVCMFQLKELYPLQHSI